MIYPIFTGVVALIAVVLIYYLQLFLRQCWKLRAFRGPLAMPLIGNCYSREALFFLRYLAKLRKRYGRMFTFFAFTKPFLVTCEPTAVRRILSDTKTFIKGEDYSKLFSIGFGQGLVTSNGEKHRGDRAMLSKFFIRSNIAKYMETINEVTIDAINTMLTPEKSEHGAHDMEEFFAVLALRVFLRFSSDTAVDHVTERKICKLVSSGSHDMGVIVGLGLPPWRIIPPVRNVIDSAAELWKEFKKLVDGRKEMLARGEGQDLDDCLAAMIANNLSDKDMADHMVTLICAGHDTTAFFSSYMCYLLATNEDAQDKLRTEILDTVGEKADLTADDVTEMKYLQKVMQETLRLYSIIPAVTRYATQEVHIKESNLTIPQGATCLIPMFLINRDPELWEDPSQFNPERFEGKSDFTSAKNGFFPFGYGTRTCIGNTLAQMESSVFMCHLLRRFKFKAEPGYKPSIMSGISLTTSNGIIVKLERI